MNYKNILVYLSLLTITIPFYSCSNNVEIYVSTKGDNENNGSLQHPVLTLDHAITLLNGENIDHAKIIIREGVYDLNASIKNIPDNTTITAFQNEKVFITGGKRVSGFTNLDKNSEAYKRLSKKVRKNILQVNLKTLGITNYGKIKARGFGRNIQSSGLMLFFNGEPMTIARWPNNSWALIKEVPEKLDGKGFIYSGNRPNRWQNNNDIWMHGYWKWDWSDNYVKVKSINKQKKEITTLSPYSRYPYTKGRRYYFFNILEELDTPGEWYLDREKGILYFYPPSEIKNAEIYVSLLDEPIIKLENINGVKIKDITFKYSRGMGIQVIGGENNLIQSCTLCNLGSIGVSFGNSSNPSSDIYKNTLFNGNAGNNNGISRCEIYNIGEIGVILGGGNRKTLTPGKNFVEDSKIYKVSQWVRTYRAAVFMYGVGNIVRHNEIYDLPHTAIFFWGNDQIVEYNNIYRVCTETTDAGALYNGRDWSQRGSYIRYNYIHQLHAIETTGSFPAVIGVYLDDFCSGITIYGNVFYKAGINIMIGGGRDNIVENNIFIDGHPAIHVDARGIDWASYYFHSTPDRKKEDVLFKRLKAINPNEPPYSEKYPRLKRVLKDEPAMPKNNCIQRNIFCNGEWRKLYHNLNDSIVCFKNNKVLEECDFYQIDGENISIDFEKDVFPENFEKIDIDEIGIRK